MARVTATVRHFGSVIRPTMLWLTFAIALLMLGSLPTPTYGHDTGKHWHAGHGKAVTCPSNCLSLTYNDDSLGNLYLDEFYAALSGAGTSWWDLDVARWTSTSSSANLTVLSSNYGSGFPMAGHEPTWADADHFASSTIKFNDYYIGTGGQFDGDNWRTYSACHELGHHVGLDHFEDSGITTSCLNTYNMPNPTAPGSHDDTDLSVIYGIDSIQD